MRKTIAIKLVGGCSDTSKMPGLSYGLPTANCKTGAKLAKIAGTICSKCYAKKGCYAAFAHDIVPAQQRRLESINDPGWVDAMVVMLKHERWFRWFDSGDLQSVDMLLNIFEVARRTPHCRHWVATRERVFVSKALTKSDILDNIVVRVSATWPDVPAKPLKGALVGNVHKDKPAVGYECPAPKQNGKCDLCRACWDRGVEAVSYREH